MSTRMLIRHNLPVRSTESFITRTHRQSGDGTLPADGVGGYFWFAGGAKDWRLETCFGKSLCCWPENRRTVGGQGGAVLPNLAPPQPHAEAEEDDQGQDERASFRAHRSTTP